MPTEEERPGSASEAYDRLNGVKEGPVGSIGISKKGDWSRKGKYTKGNGGTRCGGKGNGHLNTVDAMTAFDFRPAFDRSASTRNSSCSKRGFAELTKCLSEVNWLDELHDGIDVFRHQMRSCSLPRTQLPVISDQSIQSITLHLDCTCLFIGDIISGTGDAWCLSSSLSLPIPNTVT